MRLNITFVVAALLIIMFCSAVSKQKLEGFQLLNPATYPCNVDNPKLYGDYPVKKNPGATDPNTLIFGPNILPSKWGLMSK